MNTAPPQTFDQVKAELLAALGPLQFHPAARRAIASCEALFRRYDAQLASLRLANDNLADRVGRLEVGLVEQGRANVLRAVNGGADG